MMESQASLSHNNTSTNNLAGLQTTTVHCSEFDWETVSQTILKLDRALLHPCLISAEVSQSVLESWERLVKIIGDLRSSASGWPSNLPQTPENLAPYVTEEVYEVLEAIHNERQLKDTQANLPKLPPSQQPADYICIEDLIPRLLWYIARSADDVMRLLAGVKAQVLRAGLEWSSGTLRLVAILTVDSAAPWSIDLATKEPSQNEEVSRSLQLMPDALIQFNEGYFCRQPRRCDSLIQYFKYKIQQATLGINIFTGRTQIELLEPGKNWQFADLQVRFELEFVSNHELEEVEPTLPAGSWELENKNSVVKIENPVFEIPPTILTNPKPSSLISNRVQASSEDEVQVVEPLKPQPPLLESSVWLTDRVIVEKYYQSLIKQQLASFLSECQDVEGTASQEVSSSEARVAREDFREVKCNEESQIIESSDDRLNNSQLVIQALKETNQIHSLINLACQVVDAIENPQLEKETSWVGLEMRMADLTQKLLWHAISSSYEVMQLVGGVKGRVLQPTCDWETGMLRLIAILRVNVADASWEIDVTTGQSPKTNVWPVASNAIIQSNDRNLCKEPVEVASFLRGIISELREMSPDLGVWMDDVGVNLRCQTVQHCGVKSSEDNSLVGLEVDLKNGRSGVFQLSINLEWIPNASPLIFQ